MEIKERHFPYPIMASWSDDIAYSTTSSLEPKIDKAINAYILNYTISINNSTILQLLEDGKAKLVMHIECSNALYRKSFTLKLPPKGSDKTQGKITILADEIHGKTDATILILANENISNYSPAGIHTDYNQVSCELKKGDFIAVVETYKIPLRQEYDLLKQISTIIVFNRDETRNTGPIKVIFEEDKLIAMIPKKLHESYMELKDSKGSTSILTSMLVIPVLIEGLVHIKGLWNEKGSRSERWFNLLCKKLEDMKCDMSNASPIEVAQQILDMPYERASIELKNLLGQEI